MKISFITLLFTLLISCGDNKYKAKDPDEVETMNSGKLKVVIDESIKNVLDTGLVMYQNDYENVLITKEFKNARKSMGELLGGLSRVVVIARDYLEDEDSLMVVHKVDKHYRMKIATDALVLFTKVDYPIDTLNHSEIKNIFQNGEKLSNIFKVDGEPKYYINEVNSSEYAHFKKSILENNPLKKNVMFIEGIDEIKNQVYENNGVGFGLLSQLVGDDRFKLIQIGFNDSTGKYIRPVPVHQAYLVQGRYPYPVDYWVYLLEDRRNLPFWFASYLAKETKYQQLILDKGIVPEFARIQLVPEEN